MSSLIVIAPAVPERWCTDMFKIIIIIIHKYVLMRTTLDKSQAHRFPSSTSGAPCQQVPSPVCRRAFRHFCASTPPACTSPLKYKIISTDISPNAAMRAPKSRFPGKWRREEEGRGRHVWRLRARTALLTKNSTRRRATRARASL